MLEPLMELSVTGGGFKVKPRAEVSKDIVKIVNNQWRLAVRAGLEAMIEKDAIKVQTGMAASSWVPIARAVKHLTKWNSTHRPRIPERVGYTDMNGIWTFLGKRKGPAAGIEAGEEASVYIADGSTWSVTFKINVYHYLLHEAGLVKGSGPWNSLQIFAEGVTNFIQKLVDNGQFLPASSDLFLIEGI